MTVTLIDYMGTDLTVVNSARVSFKKHSTELTDKDTRLINYLAKHNHWTPASHCVVTLHIKMPIFVARQWFKHTVGFTRNEVSRRYVDESPEFWTPNEFRLKAKDKKQGSSNEVLNEELTQNYKLDIEFLNNYLLNVYDAMIKENVAPELARTILPQSMYTEFYETASLAAYARLYNLRGESSAQKEIQEYAEEVNTIMKKLYPVSWESLISHQSKD